MARRFDIDININTENAEQKIKNLNKVVGKTFDDIGSSSNKMGVFKELVGYLAQIDSQLMDFNKYDKNLFAKIFGGLDSNLTKETERLFGINPTRKESIESYERTA